MMKYRLAIQLYKSYNEYISNDDWMDLNLQQNFNSRLLTVQINDFSNLKIGEMITKTENYNYNFKKLEILYKSKLLKIVTVILSHM